MKHWVEGAAAALKLAISPPQRALLDRYRSWLLEEALPAGGIGPEEASRIETRHLADSLAFSTAWKRAPHQVLDIGSGVGLPGIPLAVLHPEADFELVDRSGRRVDLLERAVRVLGLDNITVTHADIANVSGAYQHVVMRAALPPARAASTIARLLAHGGLAVVGVGEHQAKQEWAEIEQRASAVGLRVELVPITMLDSPRSLLRMTRA